MWAIVAEQQRRTSSMSALDTLDWHAVRTHYLQREDIHRRLLSLYEEEKVAPFAQLVLGISNKAGNYSASEHGLGPQILAMNGGNAAKRVYDLAGLFIALKNARDVPKMIKAARIQYLQIGVGSEASCMMNPSVCWVVNTRTIWTHLVIKHADNIAIAKEALKLYRDADASSEMIYQMWAAMHLELATSMTRIAEEGQRLAMKASVQHGAIRYLWADAIANELYDMHNVR
jgi:hypothetical protein